MSTDEQQQPARRNPRIPPRQEPQRSEDLREPIQVDNRLAEALRTRSRKRKSDVDQFYIPASMVPPGWAYEWKRYAVMGAPDPSYDVSLRENGWEPVDVSRHPEYMPPGHTGAIIRAGMILMERPKQLSDEARKEDRDVARAMIRGKEAQLSQAPAGTMTRDQDGVRPKINREYIPMDMAEDE